MTARLIITRAGPALSIQDLGRSGYMSFGLSQGGAADRLAMAEGAAQLGQDVNLAALEMAGLGGVFKESQDPRIAINGAPMQDTVDDQPLVWNAVPTIKAGQRIPLGSAVSGV